MMMSWTASRRRDSKVKIGVQTPRKGHLNLRSGTAVGKTIVRLAPAETPEPTATPPTAFAATPLLPSGTTPDGAGDEARRLTLGEKSGKGLANSRVARQTHGDDEQAGRPALASTVVAMIAKPGDPKIPGPRDETPGQPGRMMAGMDGLPTMGHGEYPEPIPRQMAELDTGEETIMLKTNEDNG